MIRVKFMNYKIKFFSKNLSVALMISFVLHTTAAQTSIVPDQNRLLLGSQIDITSLTNTFVKQHYLPVKMKVTVTGYSSTPDQTDDTPFITASGKRVRDGIVAANFLRFSTKIKIPELFGDKVFIVEDRMNRRYYDRVDVWFPTRGEALRFGKHTNVEIIILE